MSRARPGPAPVGVLLVNLGSPDSPRVRDVRRYLRQFLSDRRVVDVPRIVWWPLLHLVILPFRGPKSARAYAEVWTDAGSPLIVNSRIQRDLLARELGAGFEVELAMRYGAPSIRRGIEALRERGVERVVLLPLFPQFSHATTGSIEAEVEAVLAERRLGLSLTRVPPWFDDAGYVSAVAQRVRVARATRPVTHHVFSFHGLPRRYVDRGDPYRDHCEATARALARELELAPADWSLVFQSRFGREPWLEPYADEFVPALAREHERVLVALPGFTADCLETLEEIGMRLARRFVEHGGRELVVVPALNDSPLLARALARLARAALPPESGPLG